MRNLEFIIQRNDFKKLPHILKEIQKIFNVKDKGINGAVLSVIAEIMVKSCGIQVGGKVDPDAASRGKMVTLFKKLGVDLEKAARDTSYFPSLTRPIDSKEFAEGLNIQTYPQGNRVRVSINIIHDRFMGRLDQSKTNPAVAHVSRKVDEILKKER